MHHLLCSSQTGTGRTWCCEEVPLPSNIWGYSERGIQVLLYSPKRRREIANIIDEDAVYYSGLQKTRWLASSYRAITTLEKYYVTTVMHLQHKTGSTGEDGARAKGILKQLLREVCRLPYNSSCSSLKSSMDKTELSQDKGASPFCNNMIF